MPNTRDLPTIEHRVIPVITESYLAYKSMMVTPDTIFLIDERVSDTAEFCAIYEKDALFTRSTEIRRETADSFSLRKNDITVDIYYKSETNTDLFIGLSIPDADDLEDFLLYIRKAWHFNESHKTMTPDEAAEPFRYGLFVTWLVTAWTLYLHWFGGETDHWIIIFFVRVGDKIGATGLLLLTAVVSYFLFRKIRHARKAPLYKTWLKRPGLADERKAAV